MTGINNMNDMNNIKYTDGTDNAFSAASAGYTGMAMAGSGSEDGSEDLRARVRILEPTASIDTDGIIRGWLAEWNEDEDTRTEDWRLIAFPVLADGRVALMFENTIYGLSMADGGEIHKTALENRYRVLLIDAFTGDMVGKYRFHVYDGFAATVFFRNGKLYAAVSVGDDNSYTAMQVWPASAAAGDYSDEDETSDDVEDQIELGRDVNGLAVNDSGDIIVTYMPQNAADDDWNSDIDMTEPSVISIFHPDNRTMDSFGRFYDESGHPTGMYLNDVTIDSSNRIWAVRNDGMLIGINDRDGMISHLPPVDGISAFIVPFGPDRVYSAVCEGEDDYVLYYSEISGHGGGYMEPVLCAVHTPDGDMIHHESGAFLKNIGVFKIGGMLYVVILEEKEKPQLHFSGYVQEVKESLMKLPQYSNGDAADRLIDSNAHEILGRFLHQVPVKDCVEYIAHDRMRI